MSHPPVALHGLAKCSTCVKARDWLAGQGVPAQFTDYREQPLPAESLVQYSRELGGWEKLVNRASMTWRNLPDARKTPADDAQWLALIAEYAALVRRPLALWPDGVVTVGFSEKKYLERLRNLPC